MMRSRRLLVIALALCGVFGGCKCRVKKDAPVPAERGSALAPDAVAILEKGLAAHGGRDAITNIRSVLSRATQDATRPDGIVMTTEVVHVYRAPADLRLDYVHVDDGHESTSSKVSTGSGSWSLMKSPQDTTITNLSERDLSRMQELHWRDPIFVMLRAFEPGASVRVVPGETLDGADTVGVEIRSARASTATVFLDAKTHLLRGLRYVENQRSVLDVFADYKEIAGLTIPHRRTYQRHANENVVFDYKDVTTSIEINGDVSNQFVKPPK